MEHSLPSTPSYQFLNLLLTALGTDLRQEIIGQGNSNSNRLDALSFPIQATNKNLGKWDKLCHLSGNGLGRIGKLDVPARFTPNAG
jgi:hypothetical protein